MEIRFKYTKEEWIESRKNYLFLSKTITKFHILILFLITIFIAGYTTVFEIKTLNIILIIMDVLLIIVYIYLYFVQPTYIFDKTKKYHSEYRLSFLENEIRFETDEIQSSLSWNTYSSYLENEKYIFLLQGKINYVMIPKRVFNGETEKEFMELINTKLK